MTVTISFFMVKIALLVFGLLSALVLWYGDLPDNPGKPIANGLRWIVWPGFFMCLLAVLVRGLLS